MAASRCFGAHKLVNGGGFTNLRRACRSSNLFSHLHSCSGVHRLSGPSSGFGVIRREHFLRGGSSSFDALRGCYALSRGNAERERMGGVNRYSFYKHLNGFLSDSSSSRWREGSDESVRLLMLLLLPYSGAPSVFPDDVFDIDIHLFAALRWQKR